jgi:hypothetical protein
LLGDQGRRDIDDALAELLSDAARLQRAISAALTESRFRRTPNGSAARSRGPVAGPRPPKQACLGDG